MSTTTTTPSPPAPSDLDRPTTGALFKGFLMLGLTGFGGVLPMARHMVVERRRWLAPEEFTELLGLCQLLPGGNIINMAVAIGMRFRGVAGAAAALTGLLAAPSAILVLLGILYGRVQEDPHVQRALAGLAAAAAALLIAMTVKMALPLRHSPVGIAIAGCCFVAIAILRVPLLPTMLVLTPLSILLTWKLGPRGGGR